MHIFAFANYALCQHFEVSYRPNFTQVQALTDMNILTVVQTTCAQGTM